MVWLLIIIAEFILDRLSKLWVLDRIVDNPVTVMDNFFYIRHLENHGAAFSILQGKMPFLIAVTSIVVLFLAFMLIKNNTKFLRLALSIVIGGALGNLYDRIFRGSVVDFLEFHFGSYVFPSFNLADSFVVVGTILLGIYILFFYKETEIGSKGTENEDTEVESAEVESTEVESRAVQAPEIQDAEDKNTGV